MDITKKTEEVKNDIECAVSERLENFRAEVDKAAFDGDLSDGFHSFKSLYNFRMLYNAAMFNLLANRADIPVVKSLRHHDGELCFNGGWFIVHAKLPTGDITNHYKTKYWDLFKIPIVNKAPKWDGHTSEDVEKRLEDWLRQFDTDKDMATVNTRTTRKMLAQILDDLRRIENTQIGESAVTLLKDVLDVFTRAKNKIEFILETPTRNIDELPWPDELVTGWLCHLSECHVKFPPGTPERKAVDEFAKWALSPIEKEKEDDENLE